jgi:ribosome biogenesis GTPase
MTSAETELADLGWTAFFGAQLTPEERATLCPVRVMAVHRGRIAVAGAGLADLIAPDLPTADGDEDRPAVGDWLLIDPATRQPVRLLRRASLFKRRAPGSGRRLQLIAANVDTLFVVVACNEDFNLARIERYLVLAREVGVRPIVVLTKADLVPDAPALARAAGGLQPGLDVAVVNARDPLSAGALAVWCGIGKTVALMGSSGVGKSTLINTLRASSSIATQAVRRGDGKGRHTTTVREMHRLSHGGWLLDTPGMRELQLSDAAAGLDEVFGDIVAIAQQCKFSDCAHRTEPGCAVQAALGAGALDRSRFDRWRKLVTEEALNAAPAAVRRGSTRRSGDRA